ncbi:2-oxoacid dehydrogenases acyltransferase-domain-containing protein [Delphinella strobiligena]|nr:2-oxoacid dehydrogenases acyltransferase-domain-containing protein [Delphinella strobiligena]
MASIFQCSSLTRTPLRQYLLRSTIQQHHSRFFHSTRRRDAVKPFLLADIGEGIRECQIIQWFVQPGARVEQFDKLCEVQSDKAAVEITSPFDGVVKELHYEADDMAIVGKPLLDIDIQSDISPEDEAKLADTNSRPAETKGPTTETWSKEKPMQNETQEADQGSGSCMEKEEISGPLGRKGLSTPDESQPTSPPHNNKHQNLATPAVRHLINEHKLSITDIRGSGKEGRVMKEDVHRHITQHPSPHPTSKAHPPATPDKKTPLTPIQTAMYKTMTASLQIPHFLYTTPTDLTALSTLRQNLLTHAARPQKLSPLPFILKAVSTALTHHPLLNSTLDTTTSPPQLIQHAAHNIGIAVDTPQGLLVPVLHATQTLSVTEISAAITRLSSRARAGQLTQREMQGATFTVSNIGAVGGGVVSPVIVPPQVAILGVGRARTVPAFDGEGGLVRREEAVFSWSADHRVVDGAECARAAERVRELLGGIEGWVVELR